jgi:hypothetical protein
VPSPPAPPPETLSDYRPRAAGPPPRQAATVEPVAAQARVEVKPAGRARPAEGASEESEPLPPPRPAAEAPLVAALRCAVERHPEEARRLLERYDKSDRELLLTLVRLTAGLGAGELGRLGPEEVSAALARLDELAARLRRKAPLTLDKVCFCRKIEGFGRYEPVPASHEFQAGCAGRPGERVQVYAEVRNFASRRDDATRQHETVLQSTLEIRDDWGRKVVAMDLGRCVDRSQTPRQDYFLNFQLHVPPRLPPGLYTLWVRVKDVTPGAPAGAPREASRTLDFRVCAPGAQALAGR